MPIQFMEAVDHVRHVLFARVAKHEMACSGLLKGSGCRNISSC
jgi:hypothetical protein